MFTTILRQQDNYFFAHDQPLASILTWIHGQREKFKLFAADARTQQRLSDACVELLRSGGMFDLALPVADGGLGLSSAAQARALEELARIDGSIAWCAMIGMDSGIYRGFLDPEVVQNVFPHSAMVSAGWIHPQGTAVDLGDGTCRVSGRWQFGSGIDHADVILGGVRFAAEATPDDWSWRIVVLDLQDVEIENTWDTWGLQGSGSQHYRVENLIVPVERTFSLHDPRTDGPLYRPHDAILRKMAGIPIGVAVGALLTVTSGIGKKMDALRATQQHQNDRVLSTIGRLTTELVSLRASLYSTLQSAWSIYEDGSSTPEEHTAVLVTTAAIRQRAFQVSRAVLVDAGDLLGAQAVYTAAGDLGGRLSDLNVMAQHAVGQQSLLDMVGNRILGGDAAGPFL